MYRQTPPWLNQCKVIPHLLCGSVWVAFFLVSSGIPARAQSKQVWPETDTFVKINDKMRFLFLMTTVKENKDSTEAEIGPNFDFYLSPIKKAKRWTFVPLDQSKRQLLLVRVGYRYILPFTDEGSSEHRGVLEATARYPLVGGVLASDRNRMEIRSIEGATSWRYRNRLTVEREFSVRRFKFNPYIRGEIYYDSRHDKLSRNALIFGSSFPITRHLELEGYYEHQNDSGGSSNRTVNAVGVVANLYF
jgi:hypothetical protein